MKAVKTIAALCFVAGIAIALAQPLMGADGDGNPRLEHDEATPAASPEPSPEDGAGGDGVRLTGRYPKRCMRPARGAPTGLVAARRGSVVRVGFPDQRPVALREVSGDVAWSPSGTFLAEREGRVFDQSVNPQGALFFEPREWQWSPVADCALATTEEGGLTFSIPDTKRKDVPLIEEPVLDFDLSPNGRRLAAVIEGRGLYVVDLKRGRAVQATEGPASIVAWFSNRSVLFSKSPGSGKLRYATGSGKTAVVRGALAGGPVVRCGRDLLLLSESHGTSPALARLLSSSGPIGYDALPAPPIGYDGYSGAACSPDGALIAVSTVSRGERGPLILLRADGTMARALFAGRTANPQWSDEGLMFVKFGNSGRGRLWLAEPGLEPSRTEYRVGAPTQYDWHVR